MFLCSYYLKGTQSSVALGACFRSLVYLHRFSLQCIMALNQPCQYGNVHRLLLSFCLAAEYCLVLFLLVNVMSIVLTQFVREAETLFSVGRHENEFRLTAR